MQPLPPNPLVSYRLHHRMHQDVGNLAVIEAPARERSVVRPSVPEIEQVTPADLAMLRERVRQMRMPRGEVLAERPS
jgi:hypothetical protein